MLVCVQRRIRRASQQPAELKLTQQGGQDDHRVLAIQARIVIIGATGRR
jgi:hypothetical protein